MRVFIAFTEGVVEFVSVAVFLAVTIGWLAGAAGNFLRNGVASPSPRLRLSPWALSTIARGSGSCGPSPLSLLRLRR
jgi:hypothetical protein